MQKIGIIGLGFMGRTHLEAYRSDPRARVAAVADERPERLTGDADAGNLPASVPPAPLGPDLHRHGTAIALLDDDDVDAVSICVPTPDHADLAIAALERGKHVLVEKPLALTPTDAARIADAARARPKLTCMPAHCMRFWPGWSWLAARIHEGTYGPVRAALFRRLGPTPTWGRSFYLDPNRSGGAILDLHIHDADFVRFCFGDPIAVEAAGGPIESDRASLDHITTIYRFNGGPALVTAEGAWVAAPDFPFTMQYRVHFERAVATFDLGDSPVVVHHADGSRETPELPAGAGYAREIAHFLDRIENGDACTPIVTIDDGVAAVRLIEAERESVASGRAVAFRA